MNLNRSTPQLKPRSLMRWAEYLDPLPLPKDTPLTPIDISGDIASGVAVILCSATGLAIYLLAVGW